MNASSIQAPSQRVIDQINQKLQSGEVDNGPIFMFDRERLLIVFVQVFDGQMKTWRVEPCPSIEMFELIVNAHLLAARFLSKPADASPPVH